MSESTDPPLLSDLVLDSRLEATKPSPDCTLHVSFLPGPSARQRRVRVEERWTRDGCLGRGAFGTVWREKCEQGGQTRLRAIKEIKKSIATGEDIDYTRELEAVTKFSHGNYAHCFVHSSGWFEFGDTVFIAMEYLRRGDLQRYLETTLPEGEVREIARQVLEGLGYMHGNGFTHRDLKPGNIMVVESGPDWWVKIADFGISKRRRDATMLQTLQRGTLGFAAPEAIGIGVGGNIENCYSDAIDLWSLGAVVFYALTKFRAFPDFKELAQYCTGAEFPEERLQHVSVKGREFITALMSLQPEARPSAVNALQHPWMDATMAPQAHTLIDTGEKKHVVKDFNDTIVISEASAVWSSPDEAEDTADRDATIRQNRPSNYKSSYMEENASERKHDPLRPSPAKTEFEEPDAPQTPLDRDDAPSGGFQAGALPPCNQTWTLQDYWKYRENLSNQPQRGDEPAHQDPPGDVKSSNVQSTTSRISRQGSATHRHHVRWLDTDDEDYICPSDSRSTHKTSHRRSTSKKTTVSKARNTPVTKVAKATTSRTRNTPIAKPAQVTVKDARSYGPDDIHYSDASNSALNIAETPKPQGTPVFRHPIPFRVKDTPIYVPLNVKYSGFFVLPTSKPPIRATDDIRYYHKAPFQTEEETYKSDDVSGQHSDNSDSASKDVDEPNTKSSPKKRTETARTILSSKKKTDTSKTDLAPKRRTDRSSTIISALKSMTEIPKILSPPKKAEKPKTTSSSGRKTGTIKTTSTLKKTDIPKTTPSSKQAESHKTKSSSKTTEAPTTQNAPSQPPITNHTAYHTTYHTTYLTGGSGLPFRVTEAQSYGPEDVRYTDASRQMARHLQSRASPLDRQGQRGW